MYAVYQALGIKLGRFDQATRGVAIARSNLEPGDLVFFGPSLAGYTHAGVYAGNGTMWDAAQEGEPVGLHRLYSNYVGAERYWSTDASGGSSGGGTSSSGPVSGSPGGSSSGSGVGSTGASGATQMLLDGVGQIWAKNSIVNGNWTQESPAGETAIATNGSVQMLLDGAGQIWAKNSIGNGNWTQESPAGEKQIAVGSDGTQMLLDGAGQIWAKNSIGNGNWTQESPAGEKQIAVG